MDQMKICPKCGQQVKSEALKCRYCGYWFNTVMGGEPPRTDSSTPPPPPPKGDSRAGEGRSYQSNNAQGQHSNTEWQQNQQQNQWQQDQQQNQWQQNQQQNQWQQQGFTPYPTNQRVLTVSSLITEGVGLGLKNFFSIFLAYILWGLTFWIPYINVGTTIGIINLPIDLSKSNGTMISPVAIFDARYRKYMGEFFSLMGLMSISLFPAFFFMIVPGIIITYGWSQAFYLMLDKEQSPSDAMLNSTKITYGYKSTLFFADLILAILTSVVMGIIMWIFAVLLESDILVAIFIILLYAAVAVVKVGCSAVAYRELSKRLEE